MSASVAIDALIAAFDRPDEVAARLSATGHTVVRTLGSDAPVELIRATGAVPVRLVAPESGTTPRADAIAGQALGARGRRLLERLLDPDLAEIPILITHSDAEQPALHAAIRELRRLGEPAPAHVYLLDLLHLDRPSSADYNRLRLAECADWLTGIAAAPGDIAGEIARSAEQAALLAKIDALRTAPAPRLTGAQMLAIVGTASILPPEEHIAHLHTILAGADALPALGSTTRVYVTGTPHDSAGLYRRIEATGRLIVGEAWPSRDTPHASTDSMILLAAPLLRVPPVLRMPTEAARMAVEQATAIGASEILHLALEGDERAPWELAALTKAAPTAIPVRSLRLKALDTPDLDARLRGDEPARPAKPSPPKSTAPVPADKRQARSRKSLASVATFGTYQREWFGEVRARVAAGEPFAMVNANAPQEILRALDIPFVVNQWWASIVAAKQQSRRYLDLLRERGFPTDVEAYSAQGLAATFDIDPDNAPWGGLPTPDFVHAVVSSDPTPALFAEWADAAGAGCYLYERTVDPRLTIGTDWWDDLPERWDEVLEPARIDLLVTELRDVIGRLERATGRLFSAERFEAVMTLVNEQEDYYRRTRDMIARARPAPIGIVDSMPATMVPQWHRGTEWARDAAKAFHDEVADRIAAGDAAVPNERVRLMFVGRGLWSDMGFYQRWEESHGAVFVWSMYLALAADGYIRSTSGGRDPMRALAARFLTMGDELRLPGWAGPWHVHEAKTHGVHGAVALADADPFVIRALRHAGVPVLELGTDNFSASADEQAQVHARVTAFIEGLEVPA
ncbi:2-hydroxyacyl-CoA dehydratase [Sphingomonas sp. BIUV-7]|uniref:2-hydroxyacyl-CoA dehydratase n=1 Tax=Sphingomonas natans TaxID=3063330 RepID=A0ABT8YA75_9SPHN|nr:2-hydroxyacyl-CoA dehydratase [Sphingomonas sp. BIUV-7]MDO6415238.1 2-hydroxyacyl-CoA dehydratase [Sphingomonas sp. BIUV-7]